jgi:hypothetical protein
VHHYLQQLLTDIEEARQRLDWPYVKKESYDVSDWVSDEDEEASAPLRHLPTWTGITPEMLPLRTA